MKNRKSQTKDEVFGGESNKGKLSGEKMSTVSKLCNISIYVTLLMIAGLIIFRTIKSVGLILYTFHPVFMSVGYLILMSHGILIMSGKSVFTESLSHQKRVTAHWVVQAVALVLITIGQSAIYINKDRNGWPHYQSWHSLFGLATYLLTLSATLGGTLTKYSQKLRSFVKPGFLKIGHGYAGIFVYLLAIATIFLGLNQSWTESADEQLKYGLLGAFLVTSTYVVSKTFKSVSARAFPKK